MENYSTLFLNPSFRHKKGVQVVCFSHTGRSWQGWMSKGGGDSTEDCWWCSVKAYRERCST